MKALALESDGRPHVNFLPIGSGGTEGQNVHAPGEFTYTIQKKGNSPILRNLVFLPLHGSIKFENF